MGRWRSCVPLFEEQEVIPGKNPWSHGLTPQNRKNLETVQRYAYQQRLTQIAPPDDLFADTDLGDAAGPTNSDRADGRLDLA